MNKIATILSECLAIIVLYKLMFHPTSERLILYGDYFSEWVGIFSIMLLLLIPITSKIVRLFISALAVLCFLYYELYPLSPQSFYILIIVIFAYFWLALRFRRERGFLA